MIKYVIKSILAFHILLIVGWDNEWDFGNKTNKSSVERLFELMDIQQPLQFEE